MAQTHYKALFGQVVLGFITEQDQVLAMLEQVAHQMMLIKAKAKVSAENGKHSKARKTYFSGARVQRMDMRLGTIYLYVLKVQEAMERNCAFLTAQAASCIGLRWLRDCEINLTRPG